MCVYFFVLLFYNKKQSLLWPPTDIVCTLGDTKYNAGIHQEWLKCVAAKLTLPFSWIKKKKNKSEFGFFVSKYDTASYYHGPNNTCILQINIVYMSVCILIAAMLFLARVGEYHWSMEFNDP